MKDPVNFAAWSLENLVKFATEASAKMEQQAEYITHLQKDVKDVILAYREWLTNDVK